MRLSVIKTQKGVQHFYVTKIYYDRDKKQHSTTVEKLGTYEQIKDKYHQDPFVWAKSYVEKLNSLEEKGEGDVTISIPRGTAIKEGYRYNYEVGYLFLQQIYHKLKLDKICNDISEKYKFEYDLNDILAKLIYGRILNPSSKRSTFEYSQSLFEQPKFTQKQIYKALPVISNEFDFIQSELYKNSFAMGKRKTGIIYYDCTNFFFEIEEPDIGGLRQYGKSKENRPLPIVEMGMFIDQEGIPLAMCIHPGNTNEQVTMKPLEQNIMKDYGLSKFVVCADAGLSSNANKLYNSYQNRAFIVTQSIKKLKIELKEWALDPTGWRLEGAVGTKDYSKLFDIRNIDSEKYKDRIFYKERWVDKKSFEEKLIVTFSLKYKAYQEKIRSNQVSRAESAIKSGASKISKKNANDFRRFVEVINTTEDGEVAEKRTYAINRSVIDEESKYDGFYAVCSNLDDDVERIIAINKYRWKIEECFRIMKTEFKSRPVYVSREDSIKAHFLTCYLALVVFRYLEKRLDYKFTCETIIDTLRKMHMTEVMGAGYIPSYTKTAVTNALHQSAGFYTDNMITTYKEMKKILKASKC